MKLAHIPDATEDIPSTSFLPAEAVALDAPEAAYSLQRRLSVLKQHVHCKEGYRALINLTRISILMQPDQQEGSSHVCFDEHQAQQNEHDRPQSRMSIPTLHDKAQSR
jgi:hypothetical protein